MKPLPILALSLALLAPSAHAAAPSPEAHAAMDRLLEGARQSHSSAVLVLQDGKDIGHYYAGDRQTAPTDLMSVTKSVVALGIGQLIAEGRIKSLDEPVADFYPEWRQGRKRAITVRMLMDHTSGLQNVPRTDVEIYPAPDAIQLALAAELQSDPGTVASYNNKAVNLLAGVIEKASGKPMDVFFRDGLFRSMGIHPGAWQKDRAGHPYAMAGLPLTAMDLAKLGQLVLDHGRWQGRSLLPSTFVDAMLASSGTDAGLGGLLWWRVPQWKHFDADPASFAMLRQHGVPAATVARLETGLAGAHFDSDQALRAGLRKALGPDALRIVREQLVSRGIGPYRLFKFSFGPAVAFDGNGDGGQFVVVVPAAKLVAVRQIDKNSDQESPGEGYGDFVERVLAVARSTGAAGVPGS